MKRILAMGLSRKSILQATVPQNRLVGALFMTVLSWLVLQEVFQVNYRFVYLITFNLAMGTYLLMFFTRISLASEAETKRMAQKQESSSIWMLLVVIFLGLCSIAALVTLADTPKTWDKSAYQLHVFLSVLALFISWIAVHVFFGLHYAVRYYHQASVNSDDFTPQGLEFPGNSGLVHYWDFIYLAFSIGMCYGTTDVDVLNREMRVVTLFHAVFSFFYVLVILGLVINFISSIV